MTGQQQGLSAEEREALTVAVNRYLGGGVIGWLTRLREGWSGGPAHWPTLTPGGDYAGCSCGEVRCDKPLFLLHIENLRAAYEAKVQDFSRETARTDALAGQVAAVEALCDAEDARVATVNATRPKDRGQLGGVLGTGELRAALDAPGDALVRRDARVKAEALREAADEFQQQQRALARSTGTMHVWNDAYEFLRDRAERLLDGEGGSK